MSWFDDVSKHILNHLEDYANHFFKPHRLDKAGKSIFVNSCPFCRHNDCFVLTKGVNAAKCFSCDESGTLIQIVEKLHGEIEGRHMLAEWSGQRYNYASFEPEKAEAREKFVRFQRICHKAIDYYHKRLRSETIWTPEEEKIPAHHQMKERKHSPEVLTKYKIGYSGGWFELKQSLLDEGFEEHEIKQAQSLVMIPDGYFVYPYFDSKGNLVRINCKLYVRYCRGKERPGGGYHYDCEYKSLRLDEIYKTSHQNLTKHVMNSDNLSRGNKDGVFFIPPGGTKGKKKKYLVLVEGENDVLSVEDALSQLPASYQKNFAVWGIGGNVTQGMFESPLLREFDAIYEAFDNDEAGDKYREQLDREMPDVPLKHIRVPEPHKDIDEYIREEENAPELFKEALDQAVSKMTSHYKMYRDGNAHHWVIKNRHIALRYEIDYYEHRKSGFKGTLLLYKNGLQSAKKVGDLDSLGVPGEELTRLKLALSNSIVSYYHDIRWIQSEPQRTFEELLDVFPYTKLKDAVTKQIAWYVFHAEKKEYENKIRTIQSKIRIESDIANILKEVNGYENQEIDEFAHFPKIQLAQSFFPKNGDGYMYFAKFVKDGETPKRVPCLISNKKEEIRLDLMKKKDAQCLLLINNKYELPIELEANLVDVEDLSLQYIWINKWIKGGIEEFSIHPSTIIREIEAFIRTTYFTTDDVVKVLALWIYATYFYTLFKNGFPYLVFNGAKGTGKSTLDSIVHLLAFNPTFAVSITGAALYRQVSIFGGTFILDEQENMTDSNKVNESDLASVIKAGYSDKGKVYRMNSDLGFAEGFTAFGPKVISNISGVEDVIADRCIFIETFQAPKEKLDGLIDPDIFKGERRDEVYSITSRAAISALTYFQQVDEIFQTNTRVDTGSARLTQIMRPLVTIARLVGGDYEQHLMTFYKTEIKNKKDDIALNTLEGKIKYILLSLSEEMLDLSKNRWVLGYAHTYEKAPTIDKVTGMFELDSMHFKVFAEELADNPTDNYSFRQLNNAIKNVMGKTWDVNDKRKATRITISDEGLLRKFNHVKHPHGYRYTFNVREFISKHAQMIKYGENQKEAETLF